MFFRFLLFFRFSVDFQVNSIKRDSNEISNGDFMNVSVKKQTYFKKLQTKQLNNHLNSFLNDSDLNSLKKVSKSIGENANESLLIRKKYHTAILTNNTEIIKQMLLTKTGIKFIIEKTKHIQENKILWFLVIQQNDINLLKLMELIGIKMTLSNKELVYIIKSFTSVDYYETIEFLLDFIELNDELAISLTSKLLSYLKTPNNKKQQKCQFEIIKILCNYKSVKDWFLYNFPILIGSLNIPLVDFVMNEFNFDINRLFYGFTVLNWVFMYLFRNSNVNCEFAYEMFDHFLTRGANIENVDLIGNDIYDYINLITNETVKSKLEEMIINSLSK